MRKFITATALAVAALATPLALAPSAHAQAQNGLGRGLQRVSVAYYKTPPGQQDAWLDLYRRWHRPIMRENLRLGLTISSRLYVAGDHSPGRPWDFAIITVSPASPPANSPTRAAIIHRIFPDLDAYAAGERARWALTVDHWDERFVPLNYDQEPFSVYYPVDNPVEPE